MTRYWAIAGMFLLTVVGLPDPGLCGWTFPEPANEAGRAAFMEMNSTEGLLLLRDWVLLEVEVDEEAGGLSGKRVQVVEYWIGDNSILEEAAQVCHAWIRVKETPG